MSTIEENEDRWQKKLDLKMKVLLVLSNLGFEDNSDGDDIQSIFHSATGVTVTNYRTEAEAYSMAVDALVESGRASVIDGMKTLLRL